MDDGCLGIVVSIPGQPERGVCLDRFSDALPTIGWYLMGDNPVGRPRSEEEWRKYGISIDDFLKKAGPHKVES